MNNVINFDFEGTKVRTVVEEEGDAWFVANDLSVILGYSQTNAMNKIIDKEDKKKRTIKDGENYVNQSLINESGAYQAIFGSTKPEAKRFKKWVTSVVLPSIRKTGLFSNLSFKNNDIVYQEGGDVWTCSISVAEAFGKEHTEVVKDFVKAFQEVGDMGKGLSKSFKMRDFIYIDPNNAPQTALKVSRALFNYVALNYSGGNLSKVEFIDKFEKFDQQVKLMLSKQAIYSEQNKQHIYVIENENTGLVKVGISENPLKRMNTLSNQSGCKLTLVHNSPKCVNAFDIEQKVHKIYQDKREFGEWFDVPAQEIIETLNEQEYEFGGS